MCLDVLVAMDDSPEARAALEYALAEFPDATIGVVTALEVTTRDLSNDSASPVESARDHAEDILSDARSIADRHGRNVRTELRSGRADTAVVSCVEEQNVDHLLVGSRGETGIRRVLLGSVAESIVRRAPCPVTVVR